MTLTKLYGRSDVTGVYGAGPAGHTHVFKRHPAPGYDDDKRTIPWVECSECEAFFREDGWAPSPAKAPLTPDESEWLDNARNEGDVYARAIAQSFGKAAAEQAAAMRAHKG